MTRLVNQRGEPVYERTVAGCGVEPNEAELRTVVSMLLDHLNLEAVLTNATKHGTCEIELRSTK